MTDHPLTPPDDAARALADAAKKEWPGDSIGSAVRRDAFIKGGEFIAALRRTPPVSASLEEVEREGIKWTEWDGAAHTDQPIFDAIAAATEIDSEPDGIPRIVMSARKFIDTFNNHPDRALCISLSPQDSRCGAGDALRTIRKYCDENLGPSRSSLLNKIANVADAALAALPGTGKPK